MENSVHSLSKKLKNWNGVSKKGESVYNQMFQAEKDEEDREYIKRGKCPCCGMDKEDCMYEGL